jgi:hypothetical protein
VAAQHATFWYQHHASSSNSIIAGTFSPGVSLAPQQPSCVGRYDFCMAALGGPFCKNAAEKTLLGNRIHDGFCALEREREREIESASSVN